MSKAYSSEPISDENDPDTTTLEGLIGGSNKHGGTE
jgi:hypothetical protein